MAQEGPNLRNDLAANTDVEIWREAPGDFYAPHIVVTKRGGIGIAVGGRVLVAPVRKWFAAGDAAFAAAAGHKALREGEKSMRNYGIWGSNGSPRQLAEMIELVKGGPYTIMHGPGSEAQVKAIRDQYTDAPILIRFHQPQWQDVNPEAWGKMCGDWMNEIYAKYAVHGLVGANEPTGEPHVDVTEQNYRAFGRWHKRFEQAVRDVCPGAFIHFPAWLPGHSEDQDDLGFIGYELPEVLDAIRTCDSVNAHCYWSVGDGPLHEMGGYGGGLRYRKIQRLLRKNGIDLPIWVDESGPFGDPGHVEQILEHARQVLADWTEYAVRVTYFLWADPTGLNAINDWTRRHTGEHLRTLIAGFANIEEASDPSEPPMPPDPDPPPPPPPPPPPNQIHLVVPPGYAALYKGLPGMLWFVVEQLGYPFGWRQVLALRLLRLAGWVAGKPAEGEWDVDLRDVNL